jgi:adenylosuccinate synthase
LARSLSEEFGYEILKTSDILYQHAEKSGAPTDRESLQRLGDQLDAETGHRWILDHVEASSKNENDTPPLPLVIDNVRTWKQLEHLRYKRGLAVIHAHLWAPGEALRDRFHKKNLSRSTSEGPYEEADIIKNEQDIAAFKKDADVRVNTWRTDSADTLVRVAARIGLFPSPDAKTVDVIIGGQYGSEGKGHVAAYLARSYDVLVRVGGPNAGHTVLSQTGIHTYIHIPSGAKDTAAKLILGPGTFIDLPILLQEIEDCGISEDRLVIDPGATVIEEQDKKNEEEIKDSISSTGQGAGRALARRITDRVPGAVRLAKHAPELAVYLGSTMRELEKAYRRGYSILVEGTQGSGLSLFHGDYPYVTSRDTNVSGCLAEAGIPPARVRRVILVIRPTPIRVGDPPNNAEGTSGELKHEVQFRDIAEQAGLDPDTVSKLEVGSRSRKQRRVGWFEWDNFRNACMLNSPTDIVLTFADYIDAENQNARRFEQLSERTIKFIEELERVGQAPVSLINTRFPRGEEDRLDLRTVIDRRSWKTT